MYRKTNDQLLALIPHLKWRKVQELHDDFPAYIGESDLYQIELGKTAQFGPVHYSIYISDRIEQKHVATLHGEPAKKHYDTIDAQFQTQGTSL